MTLRLSFPLSAAVWGVHLSISNHGRLRDIQRVVKNDTSSSVDPLMKILYGEIPIQGLAAALGALGHPGNNLMSSAHTHTHTRIQGHQSCNREGTKSHLRKKNASLFNQTSHFRCVFPTLKSRRKDRGQRERERESNLICIFNNFHLAFSPLGSFFRRLKGRKKREEGSSRINLVSYAATQL